MPKKEPVAWAYSCWPNDWRVLCVCGFSGKPRRWQWVAKLEAVLHLCRSDCDAEYRLGLK